MIEIVSVSKLNDSKYIKPKRVEYIQNGIKKSWDIVEVFDSVAILIYNKDNKTFVLVKQLRPAILFRNSKGFTYELCAGIVDKDKPLVTIAKEEILEETGYKVNENDIRKINSFYTSVGFAGGKQELYFCEVGNAQKISNGGGIEFEDIEVIELEINKAKEFMYDETKIKTPSLLYAFSWFFEQKN